VEAANGWATVGIEPGDRNAGISPGCGGYGPAITRDPVLVRDDVAEGYVSLERALTVYGVVIDEFLNLDLAATLELRARKGRAEQGAPNSAKSGRQ